MPTLNTEIILMLLFINAVNLIWTILKEHLFQNTKLQVQKDTTKIEEIDNQQF